MTVEQDKQDSAKEEKNGVRTAPRRWSRNLLSKTGPVARFFRMEREARKLASEGARLRSTGNLQGAFVKFQLAASNEKNSGFAADLHEMAADTMFEIAGTHIEKSKKDSCLLAAAEEYRNAALKRADVHQEKAAMLYIRAGTLSIQVGVSASAKNDFQAASDLTSRQTLYNWLRMQMAQLE